VEKSYTVRVKPRFAGEWLTKYITANRYEAIKRACELRMDLSDKFAVEASESYTFNTIFSA
jgi:hypothetical protein